MASLSPAPNASSVRGLRQRLNLAYCSTLEAKNTAFTLFLTQNAWLASYCAGGHADERPFRRLAISHSEDHVIRHGHVLPGLVDVTLVAVPLVQRAVLGPAHLEPVGPEDEDGLEDGAAEEEGRIEEEGCAEMEGLEEGVLLGTADDDGDDDGVALGSSSSLILSSFINSASMALSMDSSASVVLVMVSITFSVAFVGIKFAVSSSSMPSV